MVKPELGNDPDHPEQLRFEALLKHRQVGLGLVNPLRRLHRRFHPGVGVGVGQQSVLKVGLLACRVQPALLERRPELSNEHGLDFILGQLDVLLQARRAKDTQTMCLEQPPTFVTELLDCFPQQTFEQRRRPMLCRWHLGDKPRTTAIACGMSFVVGGSKDGSREPVEAGVGVVVVVGR